MIKVTSNQFRNTLQIATVQTLKNSDLILAPELADDLIQISISILKRNLI